MIKLKKIMSALVISFFSLLIILTAPQAFADMTDFDEATNLELVDPYAENTMKEQFNGLILDKLPPINSYPITKSGPGISEQIIAKTSYGHIIDSNFSFFLDRHYLNVHNVHPPGIYTQWTTTPEDKKYEATHVVTHGTTDGTVFTAKYTDVGSYQETPESSAKRVDLKLTFRKSAFVKLINDDTRAIESLLTISQNPSLGYVYYGFFNIDLEYELYYRGETTPINFNSGNAFLTFNSLNGRADEPNAYEYVAFQNATNKTKGFITSTNVDIRTKTGANPVYSGKLARGVSEVGFVDVPSDPNFFKNSISFQLNGSLNRFTVGATRGFSWFSNASTSLFRGNPGAPKKEVLDKDKKNIDGKEVSRGDILYYDIIQRTHLMGQDILSKWGSFSITDILPKYVDYQSAELLDSTGTKVNVTSEMAYNPVTREVKFTASNNFLQTVNKYDGSKYRLRIKVKVTDDAPAIEPNHVIENKGTTKIENLEQETNVVTNIVPNGNLKIIKTDEKNQRLQGVVFSVKDKNGKEYLEVGNNTTDNNGEIFLNTVYPDDYKIKEVSVPDGYELNETEQTVTVISKSKLDPTVFTMTNLFKRYHLNLRLVALEADSELVVPTQGYYHLQNQDELENASRKYTMTSQASLINDHSITANLYTKVLVNLDLDKKIMAVTNIVPEYYEYVGYIATPNGGALNTEHVSTSGLLTTNRSALLDYTTTNEQWLTVFIKPKLGKNKADEPEKSPRAYSWNSLTNDFGKLKK